MEDSILLSVKKHLGIADEDTGFDEDILQDINTTFGVLTQLGVGPKEGYSIEDATAKWSDYFAGSNLLHMVKSYMNIKVKILFDTNSPSAVISALKEEANMLEWRINVMVDPGWENIEE